MNLHIDEVAAIANKRFYRSRKWIMPAALVSLLIVACLIIAPIISTADSAKIYVSASGDKVVINDYGVTLNDYKLTLDSYEGLSITGFAILAVGITLGLIWAGFFVFLCYQEVEHRKKFIQDYYNKGQVLPE